VAGLRAALKKGLPHYCATHGVDVLCLQEVKCNESSAEELAPLLSMFRFHYWCSGSKPGYAGVATLTNVEADAVCVGMGGQGHEEVAVGEGRMLTLRFAAAGLNLCNVYVPNSGRGLVRLDYRMEWDDAFAAWCAEQQATGQHLLVVGDMNVAHTPLDLANPKTNVKNAGAHPPCPSVSSARPNPPSPPPLPSGFTPQEREKFSNLLEKGGLADLFRQRHEGQGGHYSFWSFMGGARARNVGWR
jgi:exodeoxyribonuclease-3